jgi:hypothetical protein
MKKIALKFQQFEEFLDSSVLMGSEEREFLFGEKYPGASR